MVEKLSRRSSAPSTKIRPLMPPAVWTVDEPCQWGWKKPKPGVAWSAARATLNVPRAPGSIRCAISARPSRDFGTMPWKWRDVVFSSLKLPWRPLSLSIEDS